MGADGYVIGYIVFYWFGMALGAFGELWVPRWPPNPTMIFCNLYLLVAHMARRTILERSRLEFYAIWYWKCLIWSHYDSFVSTNVARIGAILWCLMVRGVPWLECLPNLCLRCKTIREKNMPIFENNSKQVLKLQSQDTQVIM